MKIIVNGVFDLFHEGHKYILDYAVKLAGNGAIIVLLNSDRSASENKGLSRPKDPYCVREQNIREHFKSYRDLSKNYRGIAFDIIEFHTEEKLKELIDFYKPDLVLKGNDRPDVREIVGSDKWPVVILPRLTDKEGRNISTTRQIEEINGS